MPTKEEVKKLEPILIRFREFILADLTEDLRVEFESLKIDKPIEYCYMVGEVFTYSKYEVHYWQVLPDKELSQRLQDYILICFEKAKNLV